MNTAARSAAAPAAEAAPAEAAPAEAAPAEAAEPEPEEPAVESSDAVPSMRSDVFSAGFDTMISTDIVTLDVTSINLQSCWWHHCRCHNSFFQVVLAKAFKRRTSWRSWEIRDENGWSFGHFARSSFPTSKKSDVLKSWDDQRWELFKPLANVTRCVGFPVNRLKPAGWTSMGMESFWRTR